MLKRLPDDCVNAMVVEYTTRGRVDVKKESSEIMCFMARDATIANKRLAARMFLALVGDHRGPLDQKMKLATTTVHRVAPLCA